MNLRRGSRRIGEVSTVRMSVRAQCGSRVLVRYRKFERRLQAGIRLKPFVRQTGRIGKYTLFLILTGAPPKRQELCLFPDPVPGRCP